MSEATSKTASCQAITEKKPHRPGGCVGIFVQLFDWNRRLAKKKLFSKKLLAPARTNQSAKKLGGDEKMPKTKSHLIADENSGGFPSVKKKGDRIDVSEHKHEMRAAGLVARLMGLESMPAVHRDKHKKTLNSLARDVKDEKFLNAQCKLDEKVLNLEKGNTKVESRPQKLQKTGQFDRRAITRFGAEGLQIRNVLSRSRKHHHPKLVSPVKSPRISSSRNVSRASRLIDAATRILEPGLQATGRAKCALSYPGSMHYAAKDEALTDGTALETMPTELWTPQQNDVNVGKSSMGQTSCRNCGNLLDVVDSKPIVEDEPFVCPPLGAVAANKSLHELERMKPRPFSSSVEQEMNEIYQQNRAELCAAAEILDTSQPHREPILARKPVFSAGHVRPQVRSQHSRSPKDEPSPVAIRQRTACQNETSVGNDKIQPRATLNNLHSRRASSTANAIGPKNFVATNKNSSGRTRPLLSAKGDSYMADGERKVCSRRDDSLPQVRTPIRKRRTVSGNAQLESTGFVSSTSMRHKNVKCDLLNGRAIEPSARSANGANVKGRSCIQRESNRANGNKSNDVISFTFNSPLKHKNFMPLGLKESVDYFSDNSHGKLGRVEKDVQTSPHRELTLDADTLGALLEQKLKELTSRGVDESSVGVSAPKTSAEMILQELLSALMERQPFSPDGHTFNAETSFQSQQRMGPTLVGLSHYGDHLSPGSVLEASFSNDSCFSSSMDENSGRRLFCDSVDYSCDQLQPTESDADLVDSATSEIGWTDRKMVADLLNHISKILQSINLAHGGLTSSRLMYVKEVILNAEILFGSAALRNSGRMKSSFIGSFLLDELESLGGSMWTHSGCLLGFEESKEGIQFRRFLFDSVIECLDSNYSRFCNCGYKAWRRTAPLCRNAEMLIEKVGKEVRRWSDMAVMIPDEIIEWEMSHSLGKWTDFEPEAYETGADICCDILQVLVGEIVTDFLELQDKSLLKCQ